MNDSPTRVKAKRKTRQGRELNQDPVRLRRRRVAAGLSQVELADATECSFSYISQLENGKYSASATILARLAKALGCEITDLMPREPNEVAA